MAGIYGNYQGIPTTIGPPQLIIAQAGASIAWNLLKASLVTFIPLWTGVFLAIGITWWWQNRNNKNTTPKNIGIGLTVTGIIFLLATLIIFWLHFSRMKSGG